MATGTYRPHKIVAAGSSWSDINNIIDSDPSTYTKRTTTGTSVTTLGDFGFNFKPGTVINEVRYCTKYYSSNARGVIKIELIAPNGNYGGGNYIINGKAQTTPVIAVITSSGSFLNSSSFLGMIGCSLVDFFNGLEVEYTIGSNSTSYSSTIRLYDCYIEVDYTPPMWEYKVIPGTNTCYITKYNGSDENVTIPSSIDGYSVVRLGYIYHYNSDTKAVDTSITGSAYYGPFSGNTTLKTVTIPSTVTHIGYRSFGGCTELTKVSWNCAGSCIIGRTCFSGCTKLSDFSVPTNVKEVYGYSFENCSALTRLDFRNKAVTFKTSFDNAEPTSVTFQDTSGNLVIGCYHQTATVFESVFSGKSIYYFDALVSFVSDGSTVKSGYVDIASKPVSPQVQKVGFVLTGWSDGTTVYNGENLPSVASGASGAIDVIYTAVFAPDAVRNIYCGANRVKDVYVGTQKVKAVYIGTTRVY